MTLATALAASTVRLFGAAKIVAPFGTLYLLDGSGTVTIDGNAYTSTSTHGVWSYTEAISDGVAAEAPRAVMTMQLTTQSQLEDFLDLGVQGSPVTIYEGVLDMATGLVIEDAEEVFNGELDTVAASVAFGGYTIQLEVASVFERFFDNWEGARLSPSWHKSYWPGEKGFDQVTGINRKLPWGVGGGGTGFYGRRPPGHTDWSKGLTPLTRAATRGMGDAGFFLNPAIALGRGLGAIFNG